jgi:hypothetical protein
VGQWWGNDSLAKKEIQIDIVGVPVQEPNQKITEYLIGSCKFKNEKIGMDELRLLEHYADVFGKGGYVLRKMRNFRKMRLYLRDLLITMTLKTKKPRGFCIL